jgi:hypothetical protein
MFAFIAGVAFGITAVTLHNKINRRHQVVLENPSDAELASKIQGIWKLKDLRGANHDVHSISFLPSGVLKNDPVFSEKWFCNDGLLYFSYTRIDGVQNDRKDHLFSVIPTVDEATGTMTLAFPGKEPHAVLTRER